MDVSFDLDMDKGAEWVRQWCGSYRVRHQNHIALPARSLHSSHIVKMCELCIF
jgi:hypothetical protein